MIEKKIKISGGLGDATPDKVLAGTTFSSESGFRQEGTYTPQEVVTEEKTVTAGTSAVEVTPTAGKYISKVTVNPTPTEEKNVEPSMNEQEVTPTEGKFLSKVIAGGIAGTEFDVTPEVTTQNPLVANILSALQGNNTIKSQILFGTEDLEDGVSPLEEGMFYFVVEA